MTVQTAATWCVLQFACFIEKTRRCGWTEYGRTEARKRRLQRHRCRWEKDGTLHKQFLQSCRKIHHSHDGSILHYCPSALTWSFHNFLSFFCFDALWLVYLDLFILFLTEMSFFIYAQIPGTQQGCEPRPWYTDY